MWSNFNYEKFVTGITDLQENYFIQSVSASPTVNMHALTPATTYQGLTVPTPKYVNAIDENFPNTRRVFQVEGAISGKYSFDCLPVYGNISNGSVSDSYVEFIVSSSNNEHVDGNSLMLEC